MFTDFPGWSCLSLVAAKPFEAPVVFKIGITCTPFVRWRAYEREGYEQTLRHGMWSSKLVA